MHRMPQLVGAAVVAAVIAAGCDGGSGSSTGSTAPPATTETSSAPSEPASTPPLALSASAAADALGRVAVAGPPPVRALLVIGEKRVTLMTLQGEQLGVPLRLQRWPRGVSPDGRLVARVTKTAVLVGGVHGGSWRTVLRSSTCGECWWAGQMPSFAWSPDGRLLAVVAIRDKWSTVLRIVDRDGRVVRSFGLPKGTANLPVFHRVVAWRGERLFLIKYLDVDELVALDIRSGASRTPNVGCGVSVVAASPDGRFVQSRGGCSHDGYWAVHDITTGRSLVTCAEPNYECVGRGAWSLPEGVRSVSVVWASDGTVFRSLRVQHDPAAAGSWRTTIDSISRDGNRVVVLGPTTKWQNPLRPLLALPGALVLAHWKTTGAGTLELLSLKTGRHRVLLHAPSGSFDVRPLSHLP